MLPAVFALTGIIPLIGDENFFTQLLQNFQIPRAEKFRIEIKQASCPSSALGEGTPFPGENAGPKIKMHHISPTAGLPEQPPPLPFSLQQGVVHPTQNNRIPGKGGVKGLVHLQGIRPTVDAKGTFSDGKIRSVATHQQRAVQHAQCSIFLRMTQHAGWGDTPCLSLPMLAAAPSALHGR